MSYESHLSENDPDTRREHGVWYTPDPVVSYIVRSVDIILKTKLHCPLGFADDVRVIDPAAGEGTFLLKAMEMAMPDGDPDGFVGYEILPTPCDTANTRSRELLASYGISVDHDVFINKNTLENNTQSTLCDTVMPMERAKKRVCVVIGNPPYKLSKINKGLYDKETDLYKAGVRVDKDGLRREKNFMNLSADYVKFIRYAHKQMDGYDEGVVGFITNNSYLSGLTHRCMRDELMKTFNEIYILNLHGNALTDVSGDKNVFDIKQGVSIVFFIKSVEDVT